MLLPRERLLEDLNEAQRKAVTHGDGPLLVLAGAGSGKTRVLTYRIAYLIAERGVSPSRILAFTFTNKAAQEMRERLDALTGETHNIWVGTFHATCARILRAEASKIGYTSSFSIYDEEDQESLMREVIRDRQLSDREYKPRTVLSKISACKNVLVSPSEFRETALTTFDATVAELYQRYQEELRARNAMDFDDLIANTLSLFRNDPGTAERYSERFQHVLVDEYQDTNHAQFKLVEAVSKAHGNVFAVGDDDQSIYGWRGADVGNILSFRASFPNAVIVRLEQNYRSTGSILAAANAVVRNNIGRMKKTLWTEREAGPVPQLRIAADEVEEAEQVASLVQDLVGSARFRASEIAVLYRTNAQSRALEAAFHRAGIRYQLVGGTAFYQRREIKDLVAYLRCVVNPMDDVSFRRIVDVPPRGIGKATFEAFSRFARSTGSSLQHAAARAREVPDVSKRGAAALEKLAGSFAEWRKLAESAPAGEVLERIVEDTGFMKRLLEEEGSTGGPRQENVQELISSCYEFAERSGDASLEAFVTQAALLSSVDTWNQGGDAVTLMTAHNAKGLEFDVVVVVGLEEGLFPHISAMEDRDELEEERRLFYVALTRARERVFLWAAERRRRGASFQENAVSRFAAEIPSELLDVKRGWGLLDVREGERRVVEQLRRQVSGEEWPAVGDRVFHGRFGWGRVLDKDEVGVPRCTVAFEAGFTKRIVTKFLRREAVGD